MRRVQFPRAAFAALVFFCAAHALAEPQAATARRFMVAAAHPLAADAGVEILRNGGSAVDAAITVQLVLGLVEP